MSVGDAAQLGNARRHHGAEREFHAKQKREPLMDGLPGAQRLDERWFSRVAHPYLHYLLGGVRARFGRQPARAAPHEVKTRVEKVVH